MTDRFAATIPGPPGDAKVNHRFMPILRGPPRKPRAVLVKSPPYRKWVAAATLILRSTKGPRFADGPVRVSVAVHWPQMNRTGPASGTARGDVDALAKAVLDSLQAAGVLGDDGQVVDLRMTKHHDRERPRVEVEIEALDWPA